MSKAEAWLNYLPSYYHGIREMKAIANTEGAELDQLTRDMEDLIDQYYPETATWSLSRYEQDLNIPVHLSKPLEQRRSVVISKMRGSGKVSASMLKNVAQAYERGSIEVTVQPAEYKVTIHFRDTVGLPPNLGDLKAAMEEIKPAHMMVEYALRYLTIAEVESMTLDQVEGTTQDRLLGGGA
ncbi:MULTISPECIES: YmfQ family protein [Paenibacillus]|uniref:Phage portal protein n=1 Tax=Paenibacillus campinasensis TaxID=66347 RepID=A0A268EY22_9BACL|nr:YmfQ family protein [Paenibacillus campinasensis]PAD78018.1 phage portal protein [Paenibacillus campinasensis]